MSEVEQSRDDAGRFEGGSEQLFGREAELVSAGYTVRKDDAPSDEIGSDETSLREAADTLAATEDESLPVMELLEAQGKLDPNEALTAEQASDDFTAAASDIASYVEGADLSKFAEEVDQARLKQFKADPKSAAKFGFDENDVRSLEAKQVGEQQQAQQPIQQSAETAPNVEGLDPEVAKAMQHPQVRQAIEDELGKADAAKQQYAQALTAATQFAQANLIDHLPELAEIPVDRWAEAISILNQADPQRVQRAMGVLQRVDTLQRTSAEWQQRQAIEQQQQFQARYQEYNRQADEVLGPMTHAEKSAMAEELVSYVGELGVTREALLHEAKTNLALHHPAFQRMAADALRYRAIKNAPKAVVRADLPPVQKPGYAGAVRNTGKSSTLAALEKQFAAATGDRQLRIAAEILGLRE
ncbi:hypothetical protein ACFPFP_02920 [Bradyrhizobium sp. GCM10023182]|uniref:Uncharacterized protein n=1 Tax=Bradyrhizobium zhengyangense TaxID=2911009 RepID=A0ABS9LFV9_9BRAD|nr:hypothetical protein [Bradyrhizobium zhengyangense]MCG2665881.1 hypothetical protein [Bradyrhizobium zhengyangense]